MLKRDTSIYSKFITGTHEFYFAEILIFNCTIYFEKHWKDNVCIMKISCWLDDVQRSGVADNELGGGGGEQTLLTNLFEAEVLACPAAVSAVFFSALASSIC